jgi:hypothetical protein
MNYLLIYYIKSYICIYKKVLYKGLFMLSVYKINSKKFLYKIRRNIEE